jgi:cobalt-zinc-cadmium efflux system protein
MLEDVFGWLVVLIGAIVLCFTNLYIIDPILSILVAMFIIFNCLKNFKRILDIFLIKTPKNININKIEENLKNIDGVIDVHHVHVWTLDGEVNCATLHIVSIEYDESIKNAVKTHLKEHNIAHVTIEFESSLENCKEKFCEIKQVERHCHHNNAHHCYHH